MTAGRTLALVRLEVAAGQEPDRSGLDARARRVLDLALAIGAPIGPALHAAAQAGEDDAELRREIRVATAQARMVAIGLVGLPLVLLPALDLLLGLPLVAFYATPAGHAVLAVVGSLLVLGGLLARLLVRGVGRPRRGAPVDEVPDLLAAALRGGLPASQALRVVADRVPSDAMALRRAGLALEHGDPSPGEGCAPSVREAVELLARAELLGAPAAAALTDLARAQRAEARGDVRARAEQLPGRLAVPSVLLLLPATVLLIGAPVVAIGLAPG